MPSLEQNPWREILNSHDTFSFVRRKAIIEERNSSLNETVVRLKDELKSSERSRIDLEEERRRLQSSLGEIQKQLMTSEAMLQMITQVSVQRLIQMVTVGFEMVSSWKPPFHPLLSSVRR